MKYFRLILFFFVNAAGGLLLLVLFFKKPHKAALDKTGIRIFASRHCLLPDAEAAKEEIFAALMLIQRHDKKQMDLLIKQIKIIFVRPIKGPPLYIKTGSICHLCSQNILPEYPAKTRPIAFAGVLVYIANYAKAQTNSINDTNEKRIVIDNFCKLEQQQIVHRLSEILCCP